MTSENTESLQREYAEVNGNFRALAEVRFKLLSLVPTMGGVAIYLVSSLGSTASPSPTFGLLLLISVIGFLATLGIILYDQRNSQLYNGLIGRARFLEKMLDLPQRKDKEGRELGPGQFNERRGRSRKFLGVIIAGHDNALALIYGAILGAWFYPLVNSMFGLFQILPRFRDSISLLVAGAFVVLFMFELRRLDARSKKHVFPTAKRGRDMHRGPASVNGTAE